MADPISGKLAMQVTQLQQAQGPSAAELAKPGKGGASFGEVLAQKQDQAQQVQGPQQVEQAKPVTPVEASPSAARIDKFVSGVLKDEAKIEKMMSRCAKGQTLDQGELLQMQGLIYSYGQKIDLASKVVDKATSGLKQVMQTQV